MFNLIRMNLYRMLHTKSTWILLILVVFLAGFASYMMKLDQEVVGDIVVEDMAETDQTAGNITVETPIHADGTEPAFVEYVCADVRSGMILIVLAIFPVLFVNGEEKSGFIKNIAGQTKNREMIYLSKTAAIMVFNAVSIAASLLGHICAFLVLHPHAPFGMAEFSDMLLYLLVCWLLMNSFSCGIACLTTLVRSTALSIVAGMLLVMNFGYLLIGLVYRIFKNMKIQIEDYLVVPNYKMLAYTSPNSQIMRAVLVALVFFMIYNLLGCLIVRKRNI